MPDQDPTVESMPAEPGPERPDLDQLDPAVAAYILHVEQERDDAEDRASTDSLTNLLTGEKLQEEAIETLRDHPDGTFAVLQLDLDFFKTVNEALGHDTGDEVLQETAAILHRALRPTDRIGLIGRPGGDEFRIFCDLRARLDREPRQAHTYEQRLEAIERRIREAFQDWLNAQPDDSPLRAIPGLGVSIGSAMLSPAMSDEANEADMLKTATRQADMMLRIHKNEAKFSAVSPDEVAVLLTPEGMRHVHVLQRLGARAIEQVSGAAYYHGLDMPEADAEPS